MRKTIVTLVALCAVMAANATVLRVSNVSGSTAQYSSVKEAVDAAAPGDTIMLDASDTSYGDLIINGSVVLLGPGYWLQQNGIIQEAGNTAKLGIITITAANTVLCGLSSDRDPEVKAPNVVIKRCYLPGVSLLDDADRCVITQNFIKGNIGASYSRTTYHQITNNILYKVSFRNVSDCYIAYNTFLKSKGLGNAGYWSYSNLTFEKNIWAGYDKDNSGTNSYQDNWETGADVNVQDYSGTDVDVKEAIYSTEYGAFAGDNPYVMAGVPAAPVVEDLQLPTTVEYGTKMNVTIKVKVQK